MSLLSCEFVVPVVAISSSASEEVLTSDFGAGEDDFEERFSGFASCLVANCGAVTDAAEEDAGTGVCTDAVARVDTGAISDTGGVVTGTSAAEVDADTVTLGDTGLVTTVSAVEVGT